MNGENVRTLRSASTIRRAVVLGCLGLLGSSVGGCGGDSGTTVDARVVDLFLDDSSLDVGDDTIVRADFRFDGSAVFDDDENIVLVVRIPEGLRYRPGTAELVNIFGDDSIDPREVVCPGSGESYLEFDMDKFDLANLADPTGDADGRLKFTVDAIAPIGVDAFGAAANNNSVPFSCGDRFIADVEAGVEVDS